MELCCMCECPCERCEVDPVPDDSFGLPGVLCSGHDRVTYGNGPCDCCSECSCPSDRSVKA